MTGLPRPGELRAGGAKESAAAEPSSISLSIRASRLILFLWGVPAFVILLGLLRKIYLAVFGAKTALGGLSPLALENESSIANWSSSLLLMAIAGLVLAVGKTETEARWKPYWYSLAIIFVYLSADEGAALHELWMVPMAPFSMSGVFTFSWIVPFIFFSAILALIFLPFVKGQTPWVRNGIIGAGALYLASSIGLEMVEGYCVTHYGANGACFQTATIVEESGEMIALAIFATLLIMMLRRRHKSVALVLN